MWGLLPKRGVGQEDFMVGKTVVGRTPLYCTSPSPPPRIHAVALIHSVGLRMGGLSERPQGGGLPAV